jgi:hypothetical protein
MGTPRLADDPMLPALVARVLPEGESPESYDAVAPGLWT